MAETEPNPPTPSVHRPPSSTGSEYRDGEHGIVGDLRTTSVHASLSALFMNERFSDITIHCRGCEFKAHRAVVCTQSSFFDKAFDGGFKEAISRVIELLEDDPYILQLLLEFLYTGSYTDGVNPSLGVPSSFALLTPEEVQEHLEEKPGVTRIVPITASRPELGDEISIGAGRSTLHAYLRDTGDNEVEDPNFGSSSPVEGVRNDEEEAEEKEDDEPDEEYSQYDEASELEQSNRRDSLTEIERLDHEELAQLAADRNDLFNHLRLYIMADKYDVPALRLLARERFYRAAEVTWAEADYFPVLVDELYRSTLESDTAMRDIVCRLVGSRIEEPAIREKMRPVMEEHGAFAVGVMEYMLHFSLLW
ncbi:hypothetical protein G7046_g4000 [Stylonectria norvegica]|nr:hypothetical protein G7046_g4000 [Stylonectria norvegica]